MLRSQFGEEYADTPYPEVTAYSIFYLPEEQVNIYAFMFSSYSVTNSLTIEQIDMLASIAEDDGYQMTAFRSHGNALFVATSPTYSIATDALAEIVYYLDNWSDISSILCRYGYDDYFISVMLQGFAFVAPDEEYYTEYHLLCGDSSPFGSGNKRATFVAVQLPIAEYERATVVAGVHDASASDTAAVESLLDEYLPNHTSDSFVRIEGDTLMVYRVGTGSSPALDTFTLSYSAGVGGSISGNAVQKLFAGWNGSPVEAIPNDGYVFERWSDGVTTATRTDNNVTSDITVTAEFRRIELTLTYTAGTGGSITGETSQPVLYGESGTAVTAVPEEGYVFVRWSDGVTTATRTDSNVTSDITVTAEFAPDADYEPFAGGDGSEENPYQIDSVRRLRNMELYHDAHYVLTADIVLSEAGEGGSNFAPLFSDEGMFGGTLDGQGHKIVNLTVYNTETFYSGLFSCISASGSVTNLVLENASVSGTNFIGGIAGYTLGAVTDCTVSGSITYLGGNGYKVFAGGIAGRAEASVDGCVTDVTITIEGAQAETNVGGIVGYLAYGGSEDPMTLSASGSITASSSDTVSAGGLIGYSSGGLYLSASYATGNVTSTGGSNSRVGGLVGSGDSTITDSYATGNVTNTGNGFSSYAGGLVGGGNTVTVTDSYATGSVTSTSNGSSSYAGGLVGSGDSTVTSSYATGNVTSTSTGSDSSYAGGLVGNGVNTVTVTDSYATGSVTSTSTGYYSSYAGGLVGEGYTVTVRNSYSVSCVSAESERGNV